MEDIDVVYHCAALAYEGLSVFSPKIVVESIALATTSVLSSAIQNKVKRFIYCSCHDERTRLVTMDGLKHFNEIKADDFILSLDSKNNVNISKINIFLFMIMRETYMI